MPDISKLGELASIFNVSIDEILDNKRTSEIAKNLIEKLPVSDIQMEEIKEIAPILHEKEVETLLENTDNSNVTMQEIVSIAPFLSQKFIDDYATKLMEKILPSLSIQFPALLHLSVLICLTKRP